MARDFPLREKLAATLAVVAGIPHEHRVLMTADQVISLFQFDHDPIPHAEPFNGPAVHWNCVPRLIDGESLAGMGHREKTAKHDVPMIYRTRRVRANHAAFQVRMAERHGQVPDAETVAIAAKQKPKRKYRWPSRKMQNRNTFADRRRRKEAERG